MCHGPICIRGIVAGAPIRSRRWSRSRRRFFGKRMDALRVNGVLRAKVKGDEVYCLDVRLVAQEAVMQVTTCHCCKEPEKALDEQQLCFECSFVQTSVSIVARAGFDEKDAFSLVHEIHEHLMPDLIERLQKDTPLLEEVCAPGRGRTNPIGLVRKPNQGWLT
jgi:hypothetical protein